MILSDDLMNLSVIGVGDAGCKAVDSISKDNIDGIKCMYINTNKNSLKDYDENYSILLNDDNGNNLGNSGDPIVGKTAALSSLDLIKSKLKDTKSLILTAGFGGGTGTGALPIIAKAAKEMGILTIAIVTTPFSYEGIAKDLNAKIGLEDLNKNADVIIRISNNRIINNYPDIILSDVFKLINKVLKNSINYFINLFSNNSINVSKSDLINSLKNKGESYIGFGSGVGKNKIARAINEVVNSKIIETQFNKSTNAVMMIVGDPTITLNQINSIVDEIKLRSKNNNLNVIFSFKTDDSLVNEIRISLISTFLSKHDSEIKSENEKILQESQELLLEIGNTLDNEMNGYITGELDLSLFSNEKINNQIDDKDQDDSIIISDENKDDDDIPFFLK
ncbi:MAG: hypothetical protein HDR43_00040 [Mycoplasma sp.]|nr:hypothetical protein [Mycoplasma sp.]